jgi:hypothetical protein
MKLLNTIAVLSLLLPLFCTVPGWTQSDESDPARRPTTSSNVDKPMQRFDLRHWFGTIKRGPDGKLVLWNQPETVGYDLDNQKLAERFVGKEVRVDGSLVPPGRAIHVTGIEGAR